MKNFKITLLQMAREDRKVFLWMVGNFLVNFVFFLFGIFKLRPDSAVVKVAYGDIGGYVDGSWTDMVAFAILAVVFGVFHNIISVSLYEKYGKMVARTFLVISMMLGAMGMVVLLRLVGEG